jgi:hypothetical protein
VESIYIGAVRESERMATNVLQRRKGAEPSAVVVIKLPIAEYRKLKRKAKREDTTMTALIRAVVGRMK